MRSRGIGNPKCYVAPVKRNESAQYHMDLLIKRMRNQRKNKSFEEVAEWVKSLGEDYAEQYWFDSVAQMQNLLLEVLY